MGYPPYLLDELARIFAKVALDRLLQDERVTRPELQDDVKLAAVDPAKECNVDGPASDESSDNLK